MTNTNIMTTLSPDQIRLVTEAFSAFANNNTVAAADIPTVINTIATTLFGQPVAEVAPLNPAVSVKKSITPDFIVCLEDGKKLKMLKRHLKTTYNLSPDEYRAKWGLPADYPMVAPNYAAQRSELAHKIGLGKKPATAAKPAKAPRAKKTDTNAGQDSKAA